MEAAEWILTFNYILKCTAISDKIFNAGALSAADRVMRFLDRLSMKLRGKALEFCAQKNWKLSVSEVGSRNLISWIYKKFILANAAATQKGCGL